MQVMVVLRGSLPHLATSHLFVAVVPPAAYAWILVVEVLSSQADGHTTVSFMHP